MIERTHNPELVKQSILNAVGQLLITHGMANISIQKIAEYAQISKGGLFYHFANKEVLLTAYFDQILSNFQRSIQQYQPIENHRNYLLAYALATFDDLSKNNHTSMILLQFISHQHYKQRWIDWINHQWSAYDTQPELVAWRYAIDGIWLNFAIGAITVDDLPQLRQWFTTAIAQI